MSFSVDEIFEVTSEQVFNSGEFSSKQFDQIAYTRMLFDMISVRVFDT